jgi:hypothetical protein
MTIKDIKPHTINITIDMSNSGTTKISEFSVGKKKSLRENIPKLMSSDNQF